MLAAFLGSATKTNRTAVTAGCSRRGIGTGLQRRRLMQNQQQAPRYCCSSNVTPPSAKKKLIIINRKFSLSLSSSPPPPSRLTSQRKKNGTLRYRVHHSMSEHCAGPSESTWPSRYNRFVCVFIVFFSFRLGGRVGWGRRSEGIRWVEERKSKRRFRGKKKWGGGND